MLGLEGQVFFCDLGCSTLIHLDNTDTRSILPDDSILGPPGNISQAIRIVWRFREKIIQTIVCTTVMHCDMLLASVMMDLASSVPSQEIG